MNRRMPPFIVWLFGGWRSFTFWMSYWILYITVVTSLILISYKHVDSNKQYDTVGKNMSLAAIIIGMSGPFIAFIISILKYRVD